MTASEQAQASGDPVVVDDLTTETTQVTADPDGNFTLVSDREPVRIQRDGQWIPIDTDLVRNSDGTFSPSASDAELTFSGGGTGPALVIGDPTSDASISISWPGGLPTPTIAGPTATYADVLPGVDLVLTAQTQSYSETLVVHDATAAANPALQDLKMTFAAHGVTLQKSADGGLAANDDAGTPVFDGSTPVMWDSSYDAKVGAAPTADDPGGAATTPIALSLPAVDGTSGTATTTASLTPSAADLTGSDVTYPVYIDPPLQTTSVVHTLVVSSGAAPNNLHTYDNTTDLKVGDCAWSGCNGIGVARSFFSFDISALAGTNSWQDNTAKVFSAEVDAYQVHNAGGCTAEPVTLYTTGAFTSTSTWPGPAYSTNLGTVSTGYSDDCGSGTGGDDKFTSADIATHVQYGATLGTSITFGLKAPDEGNAYEWKRFSTNPQLTAQFSYAPTRLAATGIDNAISCNGRTYVNASTPVFRGAAHDNNNPHLQLEMRFTVYNPDGSLLDYADEAMNAPSDPNTQLYTSASHTHAFGSGSNGITYSYGVNAYTRVQAGDPSQQWGTASPTSSFTMDFAPPTGTISIGSSDYPRGNWGSIPSLPGTFYLRNDSSDAVGFAYHFDGAPPAVTSCADSSQSGGALGWVMTAANQAKITAPTGLSVGLHTLSVSMFNGGHVNSAVQTYSFYVAPDPGTTPSSNNRAEAESGSLTYPASTTSPSSNMADLTRWIKGSDRFTVAGPTTPSGATLEAGLGMAFTDPGTAGTIALYDCLVNGEHFDSTGSTCEGQTRATTTAEAYIWLNQPTGANAPATHPLYRCRLAGTGDHFDSIYSSCEGNTVDGTLGWVRDGIGGLASPRLTSLTSNDGIRSIVGTQTGATFTITFNAPISGLYAIGVGLVTGPQNGTVQFSVDTGDAAGNTIQLGEDGGTDAVSDYSSNTSERYTLLGGGDLQQGTRTITGVISAGSGNGYRVDLDYLTIAPINHFIVAPNDTIITDGSTSFNGSDNTGTLSRSALAAAGFQPGQTFTAADGIQFTPFTPTTTANLDNIKPGANATYQLPTPAPATTSEVDLLVMSTGGDTPSTAQDNNYQIGLNYVDPNSLLSPYTNSALPSVPDWKSSLQSAPVSVGATANNNSVIREPALTLHTYYNGTSSLVHDVQLYVLRVQINPSTAPLVSITLPHTDGLYGKLHVLAINVH